MSAQLPTPLTAKPQTELSPGLYIVSTPIGNLRDITLRALDILAGADIILAEDTRQSKKLLNAYNLSKPLTAYHDHNARERIPSVIEHLKAGKIVAQISDAGTPLVSDPGFRLVRAAIEAGINVIPVPGASAPIAALTLSGLPSDAFMFAGFAPNKSSARQTFLSKYKSLTATLIFFESPSRVKAFLDDALSVFGDRAAVLARELTKTYEEARRDTLSNLIVSVENDPPRGEIVVLIAPPLEDEQWGEAMIDAALTDVLPEMGVKRASQHVAELSGWAKRDVYKRALSLK